MKHKRGIALMMAGIMTLSQAAASFADEWVDAEEEPVGIGADFVEVPEEELFEDDQIIFDDQWDEPGVDDVLMDAFADDSVVDEKTTDMWETEQDADSVNDAQNLGFQEMDGFEAETLYNYEETVGIFGSSEEEKSGTCGNNGFVTWHYDGAGTLTIGGQGAMDDEDQIDIWSVVGGPDKSDVKKIVIGDEITSIGKGCFRQAWVETVELGNNISVIGEQAFEDCDFLGEIKFPDSLSVIQSYAFQDCDSLEEVVFPDHVNEIQNYAFDDCNTLQKITFGSGITTIGQNAFASSAIFNINIPSTLTYLGENAFSFCNNLNTITIPATFDRTETGREPFFSCRNIEVRIEEGVKVLPDYLFDGSFVKKMYLPSTIEKLGEYSLTCFSAFLDEDNLENIQAFIIYRGTKEEFLKINRIDNSLDDFAFEGESVHYHCVLDNIVLDEDWNSVYTYKYEDPIPNEEGKLYTRVILDPVVPRSKPVLNMTRMENGLKFSWTIDEEPIEYKLEYKNDTTDVWDAGYIKTIGETSVSCVYGDAFYNSDFSNAICSELDAGITRFRLSVTYSDGEILMSDEREYESFLYPVDSLFWDEESEEEGIRLFWALPEDIFQDTERRPDGFEILRKGSVNADYSVIGRVSSSDYYFLPDFTINESINEKFYLWSFTDKDVEKGKEYTYVVRTFGDGLHAIKESDPVTAKWHEAESHVFRHPKDEWSFRNYSSDGGLEINDKDYQTLVKARPLSEKLKIDSEIKNHMGGVCFGMSVSSFLFYKDVLDLSLVTDKDCLYEAQKTEQVKSLIAYYYVLQYLRDFGNRRDAFEALTDKEKLEYIASQKEPFLLVFQRYWIKDGKRGGGCHIVTGTDVVFQKNIIDGVEYTYKLVTYDTNFPYTFSQEEIEGSYLYFNPDTGDWVFPNYKDTGGISGIGKLCIASSDTALFDGVHYSKFLEESETWLTTDQYEDYTFQSDGKTYRMYNGKSMDVGLSVYQAIGDEESPSLDLRISTDKDLIVYRDGVETYPASFNMLRNGHYAEVNADSCNQLTFSSDGGVELTGRAGNCRIAVERDDGELANHILEIVSPQGEGDLNVSFEEEELRITGDNLKDLVVTVKDGDGSVLNTETISAPYRTISVRETGGEITVNESIDGVCGEDATWQLTDGVITISGSGSTYDYSSLTDIPWYSVRNDIKVVKIEEGITRLGNGSFCSRKSLLRPDGDPLGMDSILNVAFPTSLIEIGDSAFENCNQLMTVTIPDTFTGSIGDTAFYNCYSLKDVYLGNQLSGIGSAAFKGCKSLTKVTIPESVVNIGEGVFSLDPEYGPKSILMGSIPLGYSGTFEGCTSLATVEYRTGADVPEALFAECSSLKTVEWIGQPKRIGAYAFENTGFERAIIPASVTTLEVGAYDNSILLKEIYFSGDAPQVTRLDEWNENVFYHVTADAYYPEGNTTWTQEVCNKLDPGLHPIYNPKSGTYDTQPGKLLWHACSETPQQSADQPTGTSAAEDVKNTTDTPAIEAPMAVTEKITVSKKTTIKKPAATTNKITVKWSHFKHTSKKTKAIWKKIRKVQIQCATDKGFTNIVKTAMVNKSRTSTTVKGLKKNTTYYVRVRYYDGTGYSKWSAVKKIKTKKK